MNALWVNWIVGLPFWAEILLKMTVLLAVAWIGHFALRRANPRWRVLLWRGVAVALVAMPILKGTLPGMKLAVARAPSPATPMSNPFAVILRPGPTAQEPASGGVASPLHNKPKDAAPSSSLALGSQSPVRSFTWLKEHTIWPGIGLWTSVALALLARSCIGWRRVRRMVKSTTAAPEAVVQACDDIARALGVTRQVEARFSNGISSPFLTGLRRPQLILPAHMAESACSVELRAILAHELSHLRSTDLLWGYLFHWLSIVL